ncbi:uncharacterized protein LOC108605127 [Drosophila busckii]|uniref:uncharacterized protein LOC108605127 n=1 Tax=Drosophila busckii TaxID=30019 RepID=UPI0014329E9F|nr:uncharacterized protein LOC108605127 [Drosophila busckii]
MSDKENGGKNKTYTADGAAQSTSVQPADKLMELRRCIPFIKEVAHNSGRFLTAEKYSKLLTLQHLLENHSTPEDFFRRYSVDLLAKIESIIIKLKKSYNAQNKTPDGTVIVLDDDEDDTNAEPTSSNGQQSTTSEPSDKTGSAQQPEPQQSNGEAAKSITTVHEDIIPLTVETISMPAVILDQFEQNANPSPTTIDMNSPEDANGADFTRRDNASKSHLPWTAFERRDYSATSKLGIERRPNPTPPLTKSLAEEYAKKRAKVALSSIAPAPGASLEEARKKLARLRGAPDCTPRMPSSADCTMAPMASNSKDPRGRKASTSKLTMADEMPPSPPSWRKGQPVPTTYNIPLLSNRPNLININCNNDLSQVPSPSWANNNLGNQTNNNKFFGIFNSRRTRRSSSAQERVASATPPPARSYFEHRQAKAREADAAKKQRLLEAAEKPREIETDEQTVVTPLDNQVKKLDTSYRNLGEAAPRAKINFKIPKLNPAKATNKKIEKNEKAKMNRQAKAADKSNKSEASTSTATDKGKNQQAKAADKSNKSEAATNPTTSNAVTDKGKKTDAEKQKSDKNKAKKHKSHKSKRSKHDQSKNDEQKSHKPKSSGSSEGKTKDKSTLPVAIDEKRVDNNSVANDEPVMEPALPSLEQQAALDKTTSDKDTTKQPEEKPADKQSETREQQVIIENAALKQEKITDKPQPVPKTAVVPTGTMVVIPMSNCASNLDEQQQTEGTADIDKDKNKQTIKRAAEPISEFKSKMQRRKSMMPISSESLVDREELFSSHSLVYEDVVDHQREQEVRNKAVKAAGAGAGAEPSQQQERINRKLATIFEKSTDNSKISTQNILEGKRRTRLNSLTFNETQMGRNAVMLAAFQAGGPAPQAVATATTKKANKHARSSSGKADLPSAKRQRLNESANQSKSGSGAKAAEPRFKPMPSAKQPSINELITAPSTSAEPKPTTEKHTFPKESASSSSATENKPKPNELKTPGATESKFNELQNELNAPSTTEGTPKPNEPEPLMIANITALSESVKQSNAPSTSATEGTPKPVIKRKRAQQRLNELEKLNKDISEMYYADDVLRATGRRNCNKGITYGNRNNNNISTLSSVELTPYIRNVARRGRSCGSAGVTRMGLKAKETQQQQQLAQFQLRRLRVRIKYCEQLERRLREQNQATVKNINPAWHALSSNQSECLVCKLPVQRDYKHYNQHHGEYFFARLSPGALADLRIGLGNRPIYGSTADCFWPQYRHKCPFCCTDLELSKTRWLDHFATHTGEGGYYCSLCRKMSEKSTPLAEHVARCGAGAHILTSNRFRTKIPLPIIVCHLCEFVQTNRANMENHWKLQHGMRAKSVKGLGEELILFRVDGVPLVKKRSEAMALIKQNNRARETAAQELVLKQQEEDEQSEQEEQVDEEDTIEQEEQVDDEDNVEQVQLLIPGIIGMPPPLPEEDQVLVVNGCKYDEEDEIMPPLVAPATPVSNPPMQEEEEETLQPNEEVEEEAAAADPQAEQAAKVKPNLFHHYNKFYNRLQNNSPNPAVPSPSAGSGNVGSKRNKSPGSVGSNCSETTVEAMESVENSSSVISKPRAEDSLATIVENVSFNNQNYYCQYTGCEFETNEPKALETHFELKHPSVRWSGGCFSCVIPSSRPQLTIAEELRHMMEVHKPPAPTETASEEEAIAESVDEKPQLVDEVVVSPPPSPVPEPVAPPAVPRLRVRRFSGDRFIAESVEESSFELESNSQRIQTFYDTYENYTQERKAAPPPIARRRKTFCAAASSLELGLAINSVFSLAEVVSGVPDVAAEETVMSADQTQMPAAASNADFVVTQSVTPSYNGEAPPQVNISIEAHGEATAGASAPSAAVDRFRCMAANCKFFTYTVVDIRSHLNFHSLVSFGNKDYLKCIYCGLVAIDVDNFVRHGVSVHGLGSPAELLLPAQPTSSTELIRTLLEQRRNPPRPPAAATVTATATTSATTAATQEKTEPCPAFNVMLEQLLNPTGLELSKLFACPQRGCHVTLKEEEFTNHVLYHVSSNPSIQPLKCKHCTQSFERPAEMRLHLKRLHARHQYICQLCLATTVDAALMQHHVRQVHALGGGASKFVELPQSQLQLKQSYWVAVMGKEDTFGKLQLGRLIEGLCVEWQLRRRQPSAKTRFHPSELHVLPTGGQLLPHKVQCTECRFGTNESKQMLSHLMLHRIEAVHQTYKQRNEQPAKAPVAVAVSGAEPAAASQSGTATCGSMVVASPLVETETGGQCNVQRPRYGYVPKEVRFVCGVPQCNERRDSEFNLRCHLIQSHRYADTYTCPHCGESQTRLLVTNVLLHLSMHKRHLYQCGACPVFHAKKIAIDSHINDKHPDASVDIIIHKRNDSAYNMQLDETRWLKSAARVNFGAPNDFVCNICRWQSPNYIQILRHSQNMHDQRDQYNCPYCKEGFSLDVVGTIIHILRQHPGKRVQPVQSFQRLRNVFKNTLGFYCNNCQRAATTYQRMLGHCVEKQLTHHQYQCPHCEYSASVERNVANHLERRGKHKSTLLGLALHQFERVFNELLDSDCWQLAQPMRDKQPQQQDEQPQQQDEQPQQQDEQQQPRKSKPNNSEKELELIEVLSSDEEAEEQLQLQQEQDKQAETLISLCFELTCMMCEATANDVDKLRQHWMSRHSHKPFYFTVKPLLCCPYCLEFVGGAKVLAAHLQEKHSIHNLIGCDVRRKTECAFCSFNFGTDTSKLVNHCRTERHFAHEIKELSNGTLKTLLEPSALGLRTSYFICNTCRQVLPTKEAMAQHGSEKHKTIQGGFCFLQIKKDIIYYCAFCRFASTTEMLVMRHMLNHFKGFRQCSYCNAHQSDDFDEYIQHCYTAHKELVRTTFEAVHPFRQISMYLMHTFMQFPNGFIASKKSLRYTRYHDVSVIQEVYRGLLRDAVQPPIPRINIAALMKRKETAIKITKRRKTLNPNDLNRIRESEASGTQQTQTQAASITPVHASSVVSNTPSRVASSAASSSAVIVPNTRIVERVPFYRETSFTNNATVAATSTAPTKVLLIPVSSPLSVPSSTYIQSLLMQQLHRSQLML